MIKYGMVVLLTILSLTIPKPAEHKISDEDLYLLTQVMMAEAEGEPDEGKRWVVDTVLNRVESTSHPNSISEVIFEDGQFCGMNPDRLSRLNIYDDILEIAYDEYNKYYAGEAQSYDTLYFRTNHFHYFGTPLEQVGRHYFSGN